MKQKICATLAAFIWGTAFLAQDSCAKYLQPFTVSFLRGIISSIAVFIILLFMKKAKGEKRKNTKEYNKTLLIGGIICGIALCVASVFQQAGIKDTGPGKSAFITAMYIVIVPLIGIFSKKKVGINVWMAVAVSVVGFYYLCLYNVGFSIAVSDLYILLCAIVFAVHIHIIDYFVTKVDGVELSCVQLATMGIMSGIMAFIAESPKMGNILPCIMPLLYIAIFSSGVAYTLQIVSQKGSNPTVITLLLSLESVFAVLSETLISGGSGLKWFEILGCVLIFAAVIFAQIPINKKKLSN
ncbi:MAG: DMT family transporter [Clostridia bacterium]|nr:DMT family transporter [Clostridia bacterium]